MNDQMLIARLKDLGMPDNQATAMAADIRDRLHPIAAVAAAKVLAAAGAHAPWPQRKMNGVNGLAGPWAFQTENINGRGTNSTRDRGLGSTTTAITGAKTGMTVAAVGIAVASAASMAATGAALGTSVGPIGTAIGAVVGLIAGLMIHQGQGPLRAAQAQALDKALASIQSNYVGRTLPWIGTATAPGLQQFLQALMTGGLFMNWDPSLISSPAVNGNWANTFIAAVKAVVSSIVKNPPGVPVSVSITNRPGGNGSGQFQFVNPGLAVGPDQIAATVIMGQNGLMWFMMKLTGETDAHAQANAFSAPAQKIFALMVDKATADLVPNSLSNTLANAPIVAVPAPINQAAASVAAQTLNSGTVPVISSNGITSANVTPGYQQITATGGWNNGPVYVLTTDANAPYSNTPIPIFSLVNGVMSQGTNMTGQFVPYPASVVAPTTVGTQYLTPQVINSASPATAALTPQQDVTAGLMQQMLASQGANFSSPAAAQVLADVAANGVETTSTPLPSWALPAGLAAAALLGIYLLKGRKSA